MNSSKNKLAAVLILLFLSAARAAPGQETQIHSFSKNVDGAYPTEKNLLIDSQRNLYGTTLLGGSLHSGGTVFLLIPIAGGGWSEKVLYNFDDSPSSQDGYRPTGTLISDSIGNLYGTTIAGGSDPDKVGTVYELSPRLDGSWTEAVLHSFTSTQTDGRQPYGNLVFDAKGNLFGTTMGGGAFGEGTVYELTPAAGRWTEKILHSFGRTSADGMSPFAGLAIDPAGNLFGTTLGGGLLGDGTVFELAPKPDGSWAESILHSFKRSPEDGGYLEANPVLDKNRNLYGTTLYGGNSNHGTVFELSPAAGGTWTEKLFSVDSFPGYGRSPIGPITIDSQGNLYGTASDSPSGGGIAFELNPQPDGTWAQTVLHQFRPSQEGFSPQGGLAFDAEGNLYGTAAQGGAYADGAVFEIGAASIAVGPVATTTTLVLNPDTNLVAGQPITLTATITPASGAAFPTGTVRFSDPDIAGLEIEVPLNALGQAIYYGRVPSAGSYSIVAGYTGADGFVASSSDTITRIVH